MNRVYQSATGESASLAELPLQVEVRLGRREVTMAEIHAMQSGAVLPLDTRIGAPLDLFVGNVRLGSVEIVVRDGWVGARVVDIKQPAQREADNGPRGPEHCDEH